MNDLLRSDILHVFRIRTPFIKDYFYVAKTDSITKDSLYTKIGLLYGWYSWYISTDDYQIVNHLSLLDFVKDSGSYHVTYDSSIYLYDPTADHFDEIYITKT